jgi:hypothetical protein
MLIAAYTRTFGIGSVPFGAYTVPVSFVDVPLQFWKKVTVPPLELDEELLVVVPLDELEVVVVVPLDELELVVVPLDELELVAVVPLDELVVVVPLLLVDVIPLEVDIPLDVDVPLDVDIAPEEVAPPFELLPPLELLPPVELAPPFDPPPAPLFPVPELRVPVPTLLLAMFPELQANASSVIVEASKKTRRGRMAAAYHLPPSSGNSQNDGDLMHSVAGELSLRRAQFCRTSPLFSCPAAAAIRASVAGHVADERARVRLLQQQRSR